MPTVLEQPHDQSELTFRNDAGLELALNHNAQGYGLDHVMINGKNIGTPKRGDLFTLAFTGLRPFRHGVRLQRLDVQRRDEAIEIDLGGSVETEFARIDCGLSVHLPMASNAVTFRLRYQTDHDVAARIEFAFHGSANTPQWEANLYPWAENATSLPEQGIDDGMNRHPMVPSLRYKNQLFRYAGVPAALLRRPDRSLACLFGVAKDFEYAYPTHDWRGGVNIEMQADHPPVIVTNIKGGYIHSNTEHEVPIQLVVTDHDKVYRQTHALVESWCELNAYTAEPIPCDQFNDERDTANFLKEQRKRTPHFFDDATYATDHHRLDRFGTYPANTGFNIYLDLYLGLKDSDPVWFERVATQVRWLERMQIREEGHVADGLYCPVIPKGKHPGFYQNKEYEIEVNALGAYWLLRTAQLLNEYRDDPRLAALPGVDEIERIALRVLDAVVRYQQPDGAILQRVTDGGQLSEPVTPGHSLNAFDLAYRMTGDERWGQALRKTERWTLTHCVDPLYFVGAHPDLQARQYEEGSIHNIARYFMNKHEAGGDPQDLDRVIHLLSTAFLWRCPKQMSWVDEPTQGCTSEQTHFPQFSFYSYWCMKMMTHVKAARASGIDFFEREARFLLRQGMHAVVTEGEWAGAYRERLADPWAARTTDPDASSNLYLSELAPEYLYQLMELCGDDQR